MTDASGAPPSSRSVARIRRAQGWSEPTKPAPSVSRTAIFVFATRPGGRSMNFVSAMSRASARVSFISECRTGGEIVLDDLTPGRAPDALVAKDVAEGGVERADPMRHADDERVQADRHDTPGVLALAIERVELTTDHQLELIR